MCAETGDDFEGRSEYILVNWEMSAGLRSPFRETKTNEDHKEYCGLILKT